MIVDLSGLDDNARWKCARGNEIELVALCLPRFDAVKSEPEFLRITSFQLIPRSPDEITVLHHPSWWTPGKLLVVIGALMASVITVLIWNILYPKCGS